MHVCSESRAVGLKLLEKLSPGKEFTGTYCNLERDTLYFGTAKSLNFLYVRNRTDLKVPLSVKKVVIAFEAWGVFRKNFISFVDDTGIVDVKLFWGMQGKEKNDGGIIILDKPLGTKVGRKSVKTKKTNKMERRLLDLRKMYPQVTRVAAVSATRKGETRHKEGYIREKTEKEVKEAFSLLMKRLTDIYMKAVEEEEASAKLLSKGDGNDDQKDDMEVDVTPLEQENKGKEVDDGMKGTLESDQASVEQMDFELEQEKMEVE